MPALDATPCLRFTSVGLVFWLIASAQEVAGALPSVGALTNFTWFVAAQRDLFRYGFFAMTMFGAMYLHRAAAGGREDGIAGRAVEGRFVETAFLADAGGGFDWLYIAGDGGGVARGGV